jgi:hypothetical protein
MKLTATTVKTAEIERGKSEAIFFDDDVPGFGLRIREGGSRSFIFQYKLGDKHRRMALGKATALNLAEIRKLALRITLASGAVKIRRPTKQTQCARSPKPSNSTWTNISMRCANAFGPDRSRK